MIIPLIVFLESEDSDEVEDARKKVSERADHLCKRTVQRVCANQNLRVGRSIMSRLTGTMFCKRTVSISNMIYLSTFCKRYKVQNYNKGKCFGQKFKFFPSVNKNEPVSLFRANIDEKINDIFSNCTICLNIFNTKCISIHFQ